MPTEIESATSSTAVHAATIAFHSKNATLIDGSIYAGRYRHMLREKRPFDVNAQTCHNFKEGCISFLLLRHQIFRSLAK